MNAVHRVLTRTRTLAYQGLSAQETANILDDAEYLLALVLRGEEADLASEFRPYLEQIEERHAGFEGLVAAYDATETERDNITTARVPVDTSKAVVS